MSLLELMIVVAVIGIIAAVGLPAYRGYIDTANMSKVSSAYEYAIRLVQQEFSKNTTRVSLGLPSTIPTSDDDWIALLDKSGEATAPGGGPIYVSGTVSGPGPGGPGGPGGAPPDINATGAVSIQYIASMNRVVIKRPAYLTLTGYNAVIDKDSINITEW